MSLLDDTAIFAAVIQQGGFSHAAKYLGISNGLVSRRIAELEAKLGVTLIRRTTRQIHLTPEGELFWQHAKRISQELDSALTLIQSLSDKPTGTIRVSAPLFFGRHYLTPIIVNFLASFSDIKIDLILTNQKLDPVKENIDLLIRGAGFIQDSALKDSSLIMRQLLTMKMGLYASQEYLMKHSEPKEVSDLASHTIIGYVDKLHLPEHETWHYQFKKKQHTVEVIPKLNCNDIESSLTACVNGYGIGRFAELTVKNALQQQQLRPVLQQYDWGDFTISAVYAQQQALPKRTRMLLDFIIANTKSLCVKVSCE